MTFSTGITYLWVVQNVDGDWLRYSGAFRGRVPQELIDMVKANPELELCAHSHGMAGAGVELSFVPLDATATFCKCVYGSKPWQHYWLQNMNSLDGRRSTHDVGRLNRWVEEFDRFMATPLKGLSRASQVRLFVDCNQKWF
jgi:hypothetical protein